MESDSEVNQGSLASVQSDLLNHRSRLRFGDTSQARALESAMIQRMSKSQIFTFKVSTTPIAVGTGYLGLRAVGTAAASNPTTSAAIIDFIVTTSGNTHLIIVRNPAVIENAFPMVYRSLRVIKPRIRIPEPGKLRMRPGEPYWE